MKKTLISFLILFSLCTGIAYGYNDVKTTNSTIILNGEVQNFSVPTITYSDRTMVPMRELFEKLGASVNWIDAEQKIIATTKTKTIQMAIDNNWALCNDINIYNDVSPILYEARTMVPLRFVAEQLNLRVAWNEEDNSISLDTLGETTIGYVERYQNFGGSLTEKQTYYGELVDGVPNGVGTKSHYTEEDESVYLISEGCFKNWEKNGFITSKLPNGPTYLRSGFYVDNIKNGFGWYTDPDGNYFSGNYENDYLTGICTILFANGNSYIGEVFSEYSYYWNGEEKFSSMEAIPHGYGVITYEDGGRYEGYWQYNMRHGEGKIYWPNGNLSCEGVFENDGLNGYGKDYYESGELLYEGGHWNGVWTSTGTSYYKNGNIEYTGDWNNNNFDGYGKKYREDGSFVYEGGYKEGKTSGSGTAKYYYDNGTIWYEGSVLDGVPHGLGKEYYENGVLKYEGEFYKGGWDGFGKLYKPDGTLDFDGRFTFDESTQKSTWYKNSNPTYVAPDISYPATNVIESRIDGAFEGWSGNTIFKLINGQIWQQVNYSYHYHYSYMPKVIIYNSGGQYKMKVDGVNQEVVVKRLK